MMTLIYFAIYQEKLVCGDYVSCTRCGPSQNNIIETIDDWFTARNIRDDEGLANFAKVRGTKIKVGLQYTLNIHVYKFNVLVLKI